MNDLAYAENTMSQPCLAAADEDDHKQDSLGVLNPVAATANDELQDSAGVLNQDLQYYAVAETQEEADINSLIRYEGLPDYKETGSSYPYIIDDGQHSFCIDNWGLIEEAKAAGRTVIICYVKRIPNCSEEQLALEKMALRTAPKVGKVRYAEIIRNVLYLERMLRTSNKNLVTFSHGGIRRGTGYPSNREEHVREILAEWLCKNKDTINTYLNHGRYLTPEALEILIDKDVGKGFFDEVRKRKTDLVNALKHAGKNDGEIQETVSASMLTWLEQPSPSRTTENTVVHDNPCEDPEPSQQTQPVSQRENRAQPSPSLERFTHHIPAEEAEVEPDTIQSLKLEAIIQLVAAIVDLQHGNVTPHTLASCTRDAAAALMRTSLKAEKLDKEVLHD